MTTPVRRKVIKIHLMSSVHLYDVELSCGHFEQKKSYEGVNWKTLQCNQCTKEKQGRKDAKNENETD